MEENKDIVQELLEKNLLLSESLVEAVTRCDNIRQICGALQVLLSKGDIEQSMLIISTLINDLDEYFKGYYDNVNNEIFVEPVLAKVNEIVKDKSVKNVSRSMD